MKRAVLLGLALLVGGRAAAGEMESPTIKLTDVNWEAAAASLPDRGSDTPAQGFARLNALTEKRFGGIGKSTVPVLLPFDIDAFRKDTADGKPENATSDKYFGDFHPSKFFLAGPAGYDATFIVNAEEAHVDTRFSKPIVVEISGAAFIYELDPPNHVEFESPTPIKGLDEQFPGIRRVLSEAHVRYVFERFGVPYVLSIQCYDQRSRPRFLTCKEADPLAEWILRQLRTAGGTPAKVSAPKLDLSRPAANSDFTYYGPGDLIENTGWKRMPGRADYHVYARMRFPIAEAPGYVKSQSFMSWGDCYKTGASGHRGRKGAEYNCKLNDKSLVFDESTAENFTYPWRDNFCERRDFLVGQCPGGYGHQGEDIRPGNCVLDTPESDRCLPYQHGVAAVRDGLLRRMPGDLGVYIVVNTANDHVRFRYLHMNPKFMDADGLFNGRQVREGEFIGKVATWGDYEKGTSYHIHFNMQVFTKLGWVWVNPYMSLVAAYERQIGGRGTEILPGQPAPPIPAKPPVILNPHPMVSASTSMLTLPPNAISAPAPPERPRNAAVADSSPPPSARSDTSEKAEKSVERERPRRRHHARKRRHRRGEDD